MFHSQYCVLQGQNVLTETLLRAQERQRTESGSDQPDVPQEDGREQPNQADHVHQRERVSSSDFEPFEVIDEEVEGRSSLTVRQSVQALRAILQVPLSAADLAFPLSAADLAF